MLPIAWSRRSRSASSAGAAEPTAIDRPASSARREKRRSTPLRISARSVRARRSGSSPRSVWAIVSRSSVS
jgi:hypothetical protein